MAGVVLSPGDAEVWGRQACRRRGCFGKGSHNRMLFFYITAALFSKDWGMPERNYSQFSKKVFQAKLLSTELYTFSLPSRSRALIKSMDRCGWVHWLRRGSSLPSWCFFVPHLSELELPGQVFWYKLEAFSIFQSIIALNSDFRL